jgi:hypothetical protein
MRERERERENHRSMCVCVCVSCSVTNKQSSRHTSACDRKNWRERQAFTIVPCVLWGFSSTFYFALTDCASKCVCVCVRVRACVCVRCVNLKSVMWQSCMHVKLISTDVMSLSLSSPSLRGEHNKEPIACLRPKADNSSLVLRRGMQIFFHP